MQRIFFEVFKIMEHSFFSKHFQGSSCSDALVQWEAIDWRRKEKSEIELHYTRFSVYFLKFSEKLFQSTLTKASVTKFSSVLPCIPYSRVLNKKWLNQRMFPETSVMRLFLRKGLQFIPVLVATCNISKSRLVRRHCLTGYR